MQSNHQARRETKEERFERIATMRTKRILEDLRLLGNCANANTYSYSERDIEKIFSAINSELKRVRVLFTNPNSEFSLK